MQLELLNDQGQATSTYDVPETVFGRAYNEDLVHQVVVAFQANARQGTRAQKDREQVKHSTKNRSSKRYWPGSRRHDFLADLAWWWSHISKYAGRKFFAQNQQKDVPRRHVFNPLATSPRRPPGCG